MKFCDCPNCQTDNCPAALDSKSVPRYPGCRIYPHRASFQIIWVSGEKNWDGGIEWLATFRELKDAEDFTKLYG